MAGRLASPPVRLQPGCAAAALLCGLAVLCAVTLGAHAAAAPPACPAPTPLRVHSPLWPAVGEFHPHTATGAELALHRCAACALAPPDAAGLCTSFFHSLACVCRTPGLQNDDDLHAVCGCVQVVTHGHMYALLQCARAHDREHGGQALQAMRSAFHLHGHIHAVLATGLGALHAALQPATLCARARGKAEATRPVVAVVGAGPVGLFAALYATLEGLAVVLVEQRVQYSRDIWFDFYGPPWSSAAPDLELLGLRASAAEVIEHTSSHFVKTVRCQVLERFLARVLLMLGATLHYGVSAVALHPGQRQVAVTVADPLQACTTLHRFTREACPPDTGRIHADVLVGADGARSTVRDFLSIRTTVHDRVRVGSWSRRFKGLGQWTALLHFKPLMTKAEVTQQLAVAELEGKQDGGTDSATGRQRNVQEYLRLSGTLLGTSPLCPAPKRDPATGEEVSPEYAVGSVPAITSAFKRLFGDVCELQVLFRQEKSGSSGHARHAVADATPSHAADVAATHRHLEEFLSGYGTDHASVPLHAILDVANAVMAVPFQNTTQLEDHVLDGRSGIRWIEIRVKKAVQAYVWGDGSMPAVIVGDAHVTAYYRLGVGLYAGVASAARLRPVFQDLAALVRQRWGEVAAGGGNPAMDAVSVLPAAPPPAWRAAQTHASRAAAQQADFQALTMFVEAYCGLTLGFEPTAPTLYDSVLLFEGDSTDGYRELTADDFLRRIVACYQHWAADGTVE